MSMAVLSRFDRPMRRRLALGFLLLLAGVNAPANAQTAPEIPRYVWPPVGSQWTYQAGISDRTGTDRNTVTFRRIADQTHNGKSWPATAMGDDVFLFTEEGASVTILRAGKVFLNYQDPVAYFSWPLKVGAQWSTENRFTTGDDPTIRTIRVEATVEAFETVTTQAGPFDCFRIRMTIGASKTTRWWSPKLGVSVRTITQARLTNGQEGQRELVLTSYQAPP